MFLVAALVAASEAPMCPEAAESGVIGFAQALKKRLANFTAFAFGRIRSRSTPTFPEPLTAMMLRSAESEALKFTPARKGFPCSP